MRRLRILSIGIFREIVLPGTAQLPIPEGLRPWRWRIGPIGAIGYDSIRGPLDKPVICTTLSDSFLNNRDRALDIQKAIVCFGELLSRRERPRSGF